MDNNFSIDNLKQAVLMYHPSAEIEIIDNAYNFAEMAYADINRIDDTPLIDHALATALILADIRVDEHTIAAGLLHDIIHETDLSLQDIEGDFEPETLKLITDISKLKTYTTKQSELAYAQQLRNLFLATTEDIRVVLVRLAEKIHNLHSITALPQEKRLVVAQKAIDIYAPLADLLGVQKFKRELEDRAFEVLNKVEFETIKNYYDSRYGSQDSTVNAIHDDLQQTLASRNMDFKLYGRMKAKYSTYKKFLAESEGKQTLEDFLDTIYDKIGFTILVNSTEDCYRSLSTLRREFPSARDLVKDYIINPKPNGYKAIHTYITTKNDMPCEVQIKTHIMHEFNEFGPAAHAFYKLVGRKRGSLLETPEEKITQMKELLHWKEGILSDNDATTKLTTFKKHIYVFTPKADVIELPHGATSIDFAYHIHTKIGDRIRGAHVNNKFVGIDHVLENGDVCEILTRNGRQKPSRDWLRIAKTAAARSQIRKSLQE
ncbi:bifunctional (p)ppGpp synthetase/guanosine-3',5'-bis(diphosphate) 3'-pyrophosphohydrolase [bacterium]|uniref:TGS domain-containing protein n=1 Tax=candidate division WWE3 bacterium CG_4_9_14_3_um_filter_39_7 TaxID=1975080 RepID=A0A2M7X3U9_UNCKA|nr:bifunctional (p)ppGpp synthetase/guanosine-3',5'-bis(diphosphate) 3'-pyrophosphohydrolase [bacterium]PJA40799.1 MAG: hypothetical protein CO179_01405 [candidate division WWE3 bacterium CG_4_9_14_3_um_filter_39_7]